MLNTTKVLLLKYGVPSLAVVVIAIQVYFVNTQRLNKWKGGGYGMYTEIHYYHNQIYIPGMSVDSLVKDNRDMKDTLGKLMVMPNDQNIKSAAELILKTTYQDSIHVQIWKPTINSKNGVYSRKLINEISLKQSDL